MLSSRRVQYLLGLSQPHLTLSSQQAAVHQQLQLLFKISLTTSSKSQSSNKPWTGQQQPLQSTAGRTALLLTVQVRCRLHTYSTLGTQLKSGRRCRCLTDLQGKLSGMMYHHHHHHHHVKRSQASQARLWRQAQVSIHMSASTPPGMQ